MTSANKDGDRKKTQPKGRNPPSSLYVRSVLALYSALTHTPARPRPDYRFVVRRPFLRRRRQAKTPSLIQRRSLMDHNHPQSFVGFDHTIQGILDYLEHLLLDILSSQLPTLSSSRNFNATFRTSTSSRKSKLSVGTSTTTSPQKKEHTALRSGDGSLVPRTGDDRSRQTLHGWIDAPPSFPASRSASSPPSTSTAHQP